jgi:hypothetical protein
VLGIFGSGVERCRVLPAGRSQQKTRGEPRVFVDDRLSDQINDPTRVGFNSVATALTAGGDRGGDRLRPGRNHGRHLDVGRLLDAGGIPAGRGSVLATTEAAAGSNI